MTTFSELASKMENLQQRRAILEHLVDYLDTNFRPVAGQVPKNRILTSERREVTEETIEAEVTFLLEDIQALEEEMMTLKNTALGAAPAPETKQKKAQKQNEKED